jgi:DNA-3-methyladenine glycosylase II
LTGDPHRRVVAAPDAALAHLRRADPVLAHIIAAHPDFDPRAWLVDLPAMDAFGALVFQIAGQQLSVAATRRILERLCAEFGGRLPEPTELLALDASALRGTGLSGRKIETLRAVAEQFADGTLSDANLRALSDTEIEARLTTIAGIGPWTVHGMLIIALDRPDVVLPGDLALRKVIQRAYNLDRLPTREDVLRIAEPWRPYRSLATAYLFGAEFETPVGAGP